MWGWGRPKRNVPEVNYNESSDDEEEFDSPLVSPQRPLQSRAGSPQPLAVPTLADNVDEELEQVRQALQNVGHTHTFRNTRPNPGARVREVVVVGQEVVDEVLVVEEADLKVGGGPGPAPVMAGDDGGNNGGNAAAVNYDVENKADGDKSADIARSIKVEFDVTDIKFWFSQLEDEMEVALIGSQWLKKTVLQRNLPVKQKEDVKSFLTLQKADAGAHIYFDIKSALIRIYAPKPQDSYRKALTRAMIGLPSQLGYQIVDDVCKKAVKMDSCCCSSAVLALWSDKLPVNIRAHISNMEFNKDTYKQVFEAADKVFMSSRQVSVAALSVAAATLDETLPAFTPQNQPTAEVAAVTARGGRGGGRGSGRGGRGRGGQRGNKNGSNGQAKKPSHESGPPSGCCERHRVHGDQAWYCLAPLTCPWVNKCISRP